MGWEVGCDCSDRHSDCWFESVVESDGDDPEEEGLLVAFATSMDVFGGVCKSLKYG